jgi:hypothetical protein
VDASVRQRDDGSLWLAARVRNDGPEPVTICTRPMEAGAPYAYYAGGGTLVVCNALVGVPAGLKVEVRPWVEVEALPPRARRLFEVELSAVRAEETAHGALWAGDVDGGGPAPAEVIVTRVSFVQGYWTAAEFVPPRPGGLFGRTGLFGPGKPHDGPPEVGADHVINPADLPPGLADAVAARRVTEQRRLGVVTARDVQRLLVTGPLALPRPIRLARERTVFEP